MSGSEPSFTTGWIYRYITKYDIDDVHVVIGKLAEELSKYVSESKENDFYFLYELNFLEIEKLLFNLRCNIYSVSYILIRKCSLFFNSILLDIIRETDRYAINSDNIKFYF